MSGCVWVSLMVLGVLLDIWGVFIGNSNGNYIIVIIVNIVLMVFFHLF